MIAPRSSCLIARLEYGRPYFVPPGTPDDRVQALRRAFDATMKDPEFLADAKKLSMEIDPITGEQAQELIAKVLATPQPIAERVRKALEPPKAKSTLILRRAVTSGLRGVLDLLPLPCGRGSPLPMRRQRIMSL